MIRTVNSADALVKALKASAAGDTILLSAGNYSEVNLSGVKISGGSVTIQSADSAHMAVLNGLNIQNSSGLVFKQLDLTTSNGWGAYLTRVSDVSFIGSNFHGTAKGAGDALMIRDSKNVTITSSDFGHVGTGINELDSSNIVISSNKFHDIQSGAIRGTGVTNVQISGNTFTDASATNTTHSDVIAHWGTNSITVSGSNVWGAPTAPVTTPPTTVEPAPVPAPPAASTPPATAPTEPVTTEPSTAAPTVDPANHVYSVSTVDELLAATKKAVAGDVIQLAAGNYNDVNLSGLKFSGAVTIQSADPEHMAVVNGLGMQDASGLILKNLDLTAYGRFAVYLTRVSDITLIGDKIHGDLTGNGMMIRDSNNVTITSSDIGNVATGINEFDSSNLVISNNRFHDIAAGGSIRGSGITNQQITGNTFSDPSAVSLWQDNTANNVVLSGNDFGSVTTGGSTTTAPPATTTQAPPADSTAAIGVDGGTVYSVNSTDQLLAAAKKAVAGDVIQLAPGTYNNVWLSNLHIDGNVTITSATSTKAAIVGFGLREVSGLTFSNLEVVVPDASSIGVGVVASRDVTFSNIDVHGAASGYDGLGFQIRTSTGITVENSNLHNLSAGFSGLHSDDLAVLGNKFHDIGTDGVLGAGVSHVVVEDNSFTNFHTPEGAHPDAIQFFSYAGVGSSDVIVRGNVITRGTGNAVQGVFFEDTRDALVSGNAMSGVMYNGISVSRGSNFMISNNFLQGFEDMGTRIIVRGASSDVTVTHNTTQQVLNYLDGGLANPNFVDVGNTIIGGAKTGDLTALDSWLSTHVGVTVTTLGGEGDDYLTGTNGADTMSGGFGDDLYAVGAGDVVSEGSLAGIDTVRTALSNYTLGANVENLVLTGTTAQTGVGNALANTLVSNSVGARLEGGAGNDVLISIGGADTLVGGAGSDTFRFVEANGKVVQITDFASGVDKLDLHVLLSDYDGTNPVTDQWLKVQSDSTGSTLYVDVDGPTGAAGMVSVAKLLGVANITAADWVIH